MIFASCNGMGKTILDYGFNVVDSGFQVLDSTLCQWNMAILSLVGFRIPYAVFRIPAKPRIPDSTSKNFPDSGIRIPSHGLNHQDIAVLG